MTKQQLKELNDWLDVEIEKYSDAIKDESNIHDEACLHSFQRMKEKINEITNIYNLIPLTKEVADKFILNCLSDKSEGDVNFKTINEIKDYIKNKGFKHCLDVGFYWEISPEGDDYWRKIYDNL